MPKKGLPRCKVCSWSLWYEIKRGYRSSLIGCYSCDKQVRTSSRSRFGLSEFSQGEANRVLSRNKEMLLEYKQAQEKNRLSWDGLQRMKVIREIVNRQYT